MENPPHLIRAHNNEDADKAELTSLPSERWSCGRPSLVPSCLTTPRGVPADLTLTDLHDDDEDHDRGAWMVRCLTGLLAGLAQACFTLISPLIRGDVSPCLCWTFLLSIRYAADQTIRK